MRVVEELVLAEASGSWLVRSGLQPPFVMDADVMAVSRVPYVAGPTAVIDGVWLRIGCVLIPGRDGWNDIRVGARHLYHLRSG